MNSHLIGYPCFTAHVNVMPGQYRSTKALSMERSFSSSFFFFHLYSFFSLPLSMVRSILIAHYWSSPSLKFYRIRSIIPKTFSNKTNPSGKFHFATCAKFVSLNFFEWSLRNYWLLKNKADIIGKRKYEVFELNLYV